MKKITMVLLLIVLCLVIGYKTVGEGESNEEIKVTSEVYEYEIRYIDSEGYHAYDESGNHKIVLKQSQTSEKLEVGSWLELTINPKDGIKIVNVY